MALVPCRECGKAISTEAAACPNCGAPVFVALIPPKAVTEQKRRSGCGVIVLVFIAIVVLVGLISALSQSGGPKLQDTVGTQSAAQAASNEAMLSQCKTVLNGFQSYGLVKSLTWNTGGSMTAYEMVVDQSVWDELPFTAKSGVAKAAACEAVSGDMTAQVEGKIYDSMNHNELGKLSAFDGTFTSEEPVSGQ